MLGQHIPTRWVGLIFDVDYFCMNFDTYRLLNFTLWHNVNFSCVLKVLTTSRHSFPSFHAKEAKKLQVYLNIGPFLSVLMLTCLGFSVTVQYRAPWVIHDLQHSLLHRLYFLCPPRANLARRDTHELLEIATAVCNCVFT